MPTFYVRKRNWFLRISVFFCGLYLALRALELMASTVLPILVVAGIVAAVGWLVLRVFRG